MFVSLNCALNCLISLCKIIEMFVFVRILDIGYCDITIDVILMTEWMFSLPLVSLNWLVQKVML